MIKSFRNKNLAELFQTRKSAKIAPDLQKRIIRRLNAIDLVNEPQELNISGFNFHSLQGKPKRFSIHVNGPWCLTFEWNEQSAYLIDLEQYH